jgi:hypothetical protein
VLRAGDVRCQWSRPKEGTLTLWKIQTTSSRVPICPASTIAILSSPNLQQSPAKKSSRVRTEGKERKSGLRFTATAFGFSHAKAQPVEKSAPKLGSEAAEENPFRFASIIREPMELSERNVFWPALARNCVSRLVIHRSETHRV